MNIVEPSVELWTQGIDKVKHVAKCARVCYGRESGNDNALYQNLENIKHLSMFRHETYYSAIPIESNSELIYVALSRYMYNPYIKYVTYKDYCYIVTNGNFIRDIKNSNPVLYKYIINYQLTPDEAKEIEPIWQSFMRYTFCVVTQISTSRELNRVSPNNISEESTRYVFEDGTICRPHWMRQSALDYINTLPNLVELKSKEDRDKCGKEFYFIKECAHNFATYKLLIEEFGMHRQDARGVLPVDTATKCAYTYSIEEWRHIIDLRYYGTTGKPHPNVKIITGMIRDELINLGYNFK